MSDDIEPANRSSTQSLASELGSVEGASLSPTMDISSSLDGTYVVGRPSSAEAQPRVRISRRRVVALLIIVVALVAGMLLLLAGLRAGHKQAAQSTAHDSAGRIQTQTISLENLSKELGKAHQATEASLDVNGSVHVSSALAALTLQGDGAAITNVDANTLQGNSASFFTNASNLSSGTLPNARLSNNVALLNTNANFTGVLQHNGKDVCDASGNCSITTTLIVNNAGGGSGNSGITASGGVSGTIPIFTGTDSLGASLLSQASNTVTIGGNLNLSAGSVFQINGTPLSSANLSDVASLAFLATTQTFTGATNTFRNSSNSTSEFVVQNAAGSNILNVNSTGATVTLGNISGTLAQDLAGALVFADGTTSGFGATINTLPLTANRTISLPDASGTVCLQGAAANCGFAAASGGTGYIQNNTATQAANFNVQAATSGSVAGVLQANASGSGDILDLKNGSGTNVGTFSSTGAILFQNSANSPQALQVLNATSGNVFTVDTANNQFIIGTNNTATPSGFTITGGAAAGSNIIGGNLTFNAPNGTGVGGSGGIIFNTAGGVSNPLVTLDSTNGAGEFPVSNNAPLTWSHTTTSAHSDLILIVAVDTAQPSTPSSTPPATAASVTYNGVALTQLTSLTPSGGEAYGSIWYMVAPPTGAHNVTVTFTGPTSEIEAEATTFYNVDQTNAIANFTTSTQHATNLSTTLIGTNTGEGIFDAVMARADWTTPAPVAGQTYLYLQASHARNAGSFRQQGQSGSTTMSWTAANISTLNHVVIALTPEPNLTPDPLTQTLNITQAGTLGIDLGTSENAPATISFGGGANRTIAVNQNPGTGAGSNLTLQAGSGAVGNNNGGNLILQGGLASGTGTGGSVIVEPQTDSVVAFQILQSTGTPLLTANTSNLIVTVAGTTTTFGSLTVNNAHFKSLQTTAPAISAASNCGSGPTTAVTAGSTDSAGSFTITAGSGTPTTCDTTLTFTSAYGAAPKSVILSRTTAIGGATTSLNAQVSATSPTSFTIQIAPTSAAAGTTYSYYYWVIE